jgi:hypothetical protein
MLFPMLTKMTYAKMHIKQYISAAKYRTNKQKVITHMSCTGIAISEIQVTQL